MPKKTKLIAGLTAAALLVMLAFGTAMAQTTADGDGTSTPTLRSLFIERMAAILGLDQDQLQSAANQAGQDVVDQALADGTISQVQADHMSRHMDNGGWPMMGWGRHGFGHGGFGRHMMKNGVILDAAAATLGITRDELTAQLQDGKTLGEIADANGVDRQTLQDALTAAHKDKLDEAVENGSLTQAQADQIQQNFESMNILDKQMRGCATRGWGKTSGSTETNSDGSTL